MELGAGTALPSILCAGHGHNVVSTDIKKILTLTEKCIDLNKEVKGTI